MPTLDISDDLLAQLRALRIAANETDEQVLRRVLGAASDEQSQRQADYLKADQDTSSTN